MSSAIGMTFEAGAGASDRLPRNWLSPVRDTIAITGRNLTGIRRVPQLIVFTLIQPVIFVLLFTYVFGGAIKGLPPGLTYVDYLIPGVFVQTAVFGSIITAVGMATDLKSGIIERFRSLPMSPSAVLVGRSISDLTRNVFVVILMGVVGFLVGFRYSNGLAKFLLGMLLVLAFGYACHGSSRWWEWRSRIRRRRRRQLSPCWHRWYSPRRCSCPSPRCRAGCSHSPRISRSR